MRPHRLPAPPVARVALAGLVAAAAWGMAASVAAQPAGPQSGNLHRALAWPTGADGVPTAIAATTDEERINALRAVQGSLDDALAQDLLALVASSSVEVRRAVLETLARLPGYRQAAGAEIAQTAMRDPDPTIRAAAVALLDPVVHVSALGRQLADPSPVVRVASARALGLAQSEDALAPLQRAMADPDRDVIVAAATALGALGHPAGVHALLERVSHPVEAVRVAVVDALGVLALPTARAALEERMAADRPAVADAAASALLRLDGPLAVDALLTRLLAVPESSANAPTLVALQGQLAPEHLALVEAQTRQGRLELLPLLESAGAPAYPLLADGFAAAAPDATERRLAYLRSWLRSGDRRALDVWRGLRASGDLAPEDARALLNGAPNADVLCLHTELPLPTTEDVWIWLAQDATRLELVGCLLPWLGDGATVPHAARPSVAVALMTAEPERGLPILSAWFPGRVPVSVVASLLPALDPAKSTQLVLQLLFDDSRTVRRDVAARVSHGPALSAATLLAFEAGDWDAERLVLLRDHLDEPALRRLLIATLTDGDARARAVAVQVGWAACGVVADEHLVARLDDTSPGVRSQALAAASRCQVSIASEHPDVLRAELAAALMAQAELPAVLETLDQADADPTVLAAAWTRFATVHPRTLERDGASTAAATDEERWIQAAVAARQHPDPRVRLAAAAAARHVGTPENGGRGELDVPAMLGSDWERAVWRLVTCPPTHAECVTATPPGRVTLLVVEGPTGAARPDVSTVVVDRDGLLHLIPVGPTGLVLLNWEGVRGAVVPVDLRYGPP